MYLKNKETEPLDDLKGTATTINGRRNYNSSCHDKEKCTKEQGHMYSLYVLQNFWILSLLIA